MPLLILLLLLPVVLIALTPLMLIQRYRIGTAQLLQRNGLTERSVLQPGMRLRIV